MVSRYQDTSEEEQQLTGLHVRIPDPLYMRLRLLVGKTKGSTMQAEVTAALERHLKRRKA